MKVRMRKKEVVSAALPMQYWVPLSNLDLLLPPLQVGVFFCYKTSAATFVEALKVALSKTLVSYYAFGGEVVINNKSGELELFCSNGGVDFFQASADVRLNQLDLHNPDASVQGKLVPTITRGVLAVQVTEFKCGGVVVGCMFDHRIADAYSANMFLVSWADAARSNSSPSLIPSFHRSILSPRRPPPATHPSLDHWYVTISKLASPTAEEEKQLNNIDDMTKMISRIFYIQADVLKDLQKLAFNGGSENQPSKFESFCSFLWKLISKFATNDDIVSDTMMKKKMMSRIGVVVDGRSRLGNMDTYFGNVISIPFVEKPAEEVAEKPLSWVAQEVHQFLDHAATKEHFLGLIDWVEARRNEPNAARIYLKGGRVDKGWPAFVVSSGQRFPITKVDFGWGKPVFGSYHFPWGGDSGYVMPMPSPHDNGDWVVYMHLSKLHLDFIYSEASHVFRPLIPTYFCWC